MWMQRRARICARRTSRAGRPRQHTASSSGIVFKSLSVRGFEKSEGSKGSRFDRFQGFDGSIHAGGDAHRTKAPPGTLELEHAEPEPVEPPNLRTLEPSSHSSTTDTVPQMPVRVMTIDRRAPRVLVVSVVLTAVLYVIPFGRTVAWPLVLISTLAHELGHGLA